MNIAYTDARGRKIHFSSDSLKAPITPITDLNEKYKQINDDLLLLNQLKNENESLNNKNKHLFNDHKTLLGLYRDLDSEHDKLQLDFDKARDEYDKNLAELNSLHISTVEEYKNQVNKISEAYERLKQNYESEKDLLTNYNAKKNQLNEVLKDEENKKKQERLIKLSQPISRSSSISSLKK
jgi:chromosome segregation ATPase